MPQTARPASVWPPQAPSARDGLLRVVAILSAVYDGLLGLSLLLLRDQLTAWFGVPAPSPAIHADLNGLFALAIGLGYLLAATDPARYRGYLWVMGPGLKGAGALWFVVDRLARGSPPAYLLFAAADGALAVVTLAALLATRRFRSAAGGGSSAA